METASSYRPRARRLSRMNQWIDNASKSESFKENKPLKTSKSLALTQKALEIIIIELKSRMKLDIRTTMMSLPNHT